MNEITNQLQLVLSAIGRHIDDYQSIEMMDLYEWLEDIMLMSEREEEE